MTAHLPHRLAGVVSSPAAPVTPIASGPFDTEGRRPQPLDPWATNGGLGTADERRDTASAVGGQPERRSVKDADAGLFPAPHKMPCLECDGEGTVEVLDLDATRPHCAICDTCDGTGLVEPYCEVCQGKLTVDGWCYDCDDWGSLVYVERIAPGRVAL